MKTATKNAITAAGYKLFGNYVKINDVLYPVPLVQGNTKLGNDVYHSSTAPTNKTITACGKDGKTVSEKGTCPMSCKGCYGTTGNYQFNSSKYSLIMRTKLLKEYPEIYFHLIALQLENEDVKKLRIHAVGDFIPGESKGFYNVLKNCHSVKAWTYTKVSDDNDIELLNTLPNCNVVKSIIPGYGFNYGHNAYIASVYYHLKRLGKSVYICRCGIDENQHCSNCDGCSDHEYVLFLEHSTGYNPRTDYGYEKIVALIESQNS